MTKWLFYDILLPINITKRTISDNLKRFLITAALKVFNFLKNASKAIKIASGRTAGFWLFLYRIILKYPLLGLYYAYRKAEKILEQLKNISKLSGDPLAQFFTPLVILTLFGAAIVTSNLNATEIRSEHYGAKTLLFKIIPPMGEFEDASLFDEEMQEGPLNIQPSSNSYVQDVISTDKEPADYGSGFNTLISPTQNETALISPEITDPSAVVKKRDKIIDYVIQPGDSISVIASRFGISVNTILWENNLSLNSLIKDGKVLKILPVSGVTHKVSKNETIKSIAAKYKADQNQILEFNKIESSDQIQIGQALIVPGGVKAITSSPSSSYASQNIAAPKTPAQISSTKLQWPTTSYRITQYFSSRHAGIDIGNKIGQPTYASEAGVVAAAGWNASGYGYYIIIDHGAGVQTLYAHHNKLYVKTGQRVERGQIIGAVGSTGRSTGPHLHFEVRINGRRVNPLGYIK